MSLRTYDGQRCVVWVADELQRGRDAGWNGRLLSGYRTRRQQLAAATNYANALGLELVDVYPAGPLASNHCGTRWPRGAADVSHPEQLHDILAGLGTRGRRRRLVWAPSVGLDDRAHFSRTGH